MKISQWIRDRRTAADLTQAELAGKTGVTQPIVSQWERGIADPSPIALQKLHGLFGDPGGEIILKPVHRTILDLQSSVQPKGRPEDFGSIRRQVVMARGRMRAKPNA